MAKKFTWVVAFDVDETWVADGFEMTPEIALRMLSNELNYAYDSELAARIVRAPKPVAIRRAQGYLADEAA